MYGTYRERDFLWGALVGGTIATLTALLFTTKKGKQIQEQLVDTYDEVKEGVKNTFAESKDKVEETVDQVNKKANLKSKHEDLQR